METATDRAERVRVENPERANLLALIMKGLLAANLEDPKKSARAKTLSGEVEIRAGGMAAGLRFDGGSVVVTSGPSAKARARVVGAMPALLDVVLRRNLVRSFLTGRIRIGGDPFFLLRLLPFIAEPKNAGGAS